MSDNYVECYFNKQCIEAEKNKMLHEVCRVASENQYIVEYKGVFELRQLKGKEEFELIFN